MSVDIEQGEISFDGRLKLNSFLTKDEIFKINGYSWERWPDRGIETNSYRSVFKLKYETQGDIYLVLNFSRPNDNSATLHSWRFAPEKLLIGEQSKVEGKITKRLREWFKEKTKVSLPLYGEWGHIDATYDPHNRTGTIFCNYRESFKDEIAWGEYRKNNKF